MEEPLEAAAAAGGKACFADELLLLDFTSNTYRPAAAAATAAAASGELQHQALLFQDFFDPSVDGLPGLPAEGGGGGDEEEEELEWLADKDAFPALETSFVIPAHSRSSSSSSGGSGSGVGAAAGAGAVGERPSPVSALAAAASFSVPARPRSKGPRRRRRVLAGLSPEPAATAGAALPERRRCRHCQAEETPQWRAGPEGPKTLCNACGVRYKSGRLVPEYRPASSPTFSSAIHSNSHRRILEMRRQKASTQRRSTRAPPPPLVTPPVM